jgi:hypothetical protein
MLGTHPRAAVPYVFTITTQTIQDPLSLSSRAGREGRGAGRRAGSSAKASAMSHHTGPRPSLSATHSPLVLSLSYTPAPGPLPWSGISDLSHGKPEVVGSAVVVCAAVGTAAMRSRRQQKSAAELLGAAKDDRC